MIKPFFFWVFLRAINGRIVSPRAWATHNELWYHRFRDHPSFLEKGFTKSLRGDAGKKDEYLESSFPAAGP
jgi:hypothetical protein